MTIKTLIKRLETNIRADIDDSESPLDVEDLLCIRDITQSLIDRAILDAIQFETGSHATSQTPPTPC